MGFSYIVFCQLIISISDSLESIYRSFYIFNCRQLFHSIFAYYMRTVHLNFIKLIIISIHNTLSLPHILQVLINFLILDILIAFRTCHKFLSRHHKSPFSITNLFHTAKEQNICRVSEILIVSNLKAWWEMVYLFLSFIIFPSQNYRTRMEQIWVALVYSRGASW